MYSCTRFLREFSDYRDGLMNPAERAVVESHLAGCSSCSGYAHVLAKGVEQLRAIPEIEPSEDFLPRLQQHIHAIQDGYALPARRTSSATSAGFVVAVAVAISAAAWLPLALPRTPVVELPAVAALAPQNSDTVHSLFRAGPLLTSSPRVLSGEAYRQSIFPEYTPIRMQTYRTSLNGSR